MMFQDLPPEIRVVLGNEAIRMLADGVASAKDIDTAMVLGYKHPMGPLALSDLVGLDVRRDILKIYNNHLAMIPTHPTHYWKNWFRKIDSAEKLGLESMIGPVEKQVKLNYQSSNQISVFAFR